jgi:hypothetical protein
MKCKSLLRYVIPCVALYGCNANVTDTRDEQFVSMPIGSSREHVVSIMGAPSHTNRIEILSLTCEELTWTTPLGNRVYGVRLVQNRLVSKTSGQ